jgi:FlaA1/EpsC-like NDP-sugar epimerase
MNYLSNLTGRTIEEIVGFIAIVLFLSGFFLAWRFLSKKHKVELEKLSEFCKENMSVFKKEIEELTNEKSQWNKGFQEIEILKNNIELENKKLLKLRQQSRETQKEINQNLDVKKALEKINALAENLTKAIIFNENAFRAKIASYASTGSIKKGEEALSKEAERVKATDLLGNPFIGIAKDSTKPSV